ACRAPLTICLRFANGPASAGECGGDGVPDTGRARGPRWRADTVARRAAPACAARVLAAPRQPGRPDRTAARRGLGRAAGAQSKFWCSRSDLAVAQALGRRAD